MQDFFIQPQVNSTNNKIYGYEVFLRENVDGNWKHPKEDSKISLSKQVKIVAKTACIIMQKASNIESISFNLTKLQAEDPDSIKSLISLQKRIQPLQLIVELEDEVELPILKKLSSDLHTQGIELAIDDVGVGTNTFKNIESALPYVDKLKFTMNVSQKDEPDSKRLSFWKEQAEDNDLDIIIKGVRCQNDQKIAEDLNIDILQGYYYGEPVLI